jgi:predicted MPP superfamily phosphohydrolase
MLVESSILKVKRYKTVTPHMYHSLKILHLTDIHLERISRREIKILKILENETPDLILITGDYLNYSYKNDIEAKQQLINFLSELKAKIGIYATVGSQNIDNKNDIERLFRNTNIKLLQNQVATIIFNDKSKISVIGINCTNDKEEDKRLFFKIKDDVLDDSFKILLYHSPELMPLVKNYDIDLYLCGHTHGGQIRLPFYGAVLTASITGKKYERGMYNENGTKLYVNSGVGLEGWNAPRMRLLCPGEIAFINLEK